MRETDREAAFPFYIPDKLAMQALLTVCVCVCVVVCKSDTSFMWPHTHTHPHSYTTAAQREEWLRCRMERQLRMILLTFISLHHNLIIKQFYFHFSLKMLMPFRYMDQQLFDPAELHGRHLVLHTDKQETAGWKHDLI